MTPEQIKALFISAAETDRRLPDTARPAKLRAQAIPYFHDQADMNGWGGERYAEERSDFLEALSTRIKSQDVSRWELCNALIVFVKRERDRRCLWHWAIAKAGGRPFDHWCRHEEHISRNYGIECKNRAIEDIFNVLHCGTSQHNENGGFATLQITPDFGDKDDMIASDVQTSWMAPGARPVCGFDESLLDFSWAEAQNKRRREREARKRKAA